MGRRIVDPRGVPVAWWGVILLFYPLLALASAGLAVAFGATSRPLDLPGAMARLEDPAGLLVMSAFLLSVGPLPEEIGWRGYLQDRLQSRWSALAAALAIGLVWWAWHLPLFILPGYFDAFERGTPTPLDFFYNIMPAAVLHAWAFNRTCRSVLAVVVFHFMENFTSEFLGVADAMQPHRLALLVVFAALVAMWAGPRAPRPPGATEEVPR